MSRTFFNSQIAKTERKNTLLFFSGTVVLIFFCCFTVLAKYLGDNVRGIKLIRLVSIFEKRKCENADVFDLSSFSVKNEEEQKVIVHRSKKYFVI